MANATKKSRTPRTQSQPRAAAKPAAQGQSTGDRDADLQAFLDAFARFLTAGSGDRIAQMWEYPALVVGDTTLMAVANAAETEKFFGGAKDQYNERGIADTRADIQDSTWLTDRIVTATVRWPYLDGDDNEVGEETSTYTLRRNDDGELRLCVAVMHGAKET
jgi:hypothetical protein